LAKKVALAVVIMLVLVAVALLITFGGLQSNQQILNTGQITGVGVGVYQDVACTANLTSISWGSIDPGCSTRYLAYIENTGDAVEVLSLAASNWNPVSAGVVLALSWNAPVTLQPGEIAAVNFTLTAAADTENLTSFSFTITVMGSG
jgi:hypothetical protein